MRLLTDEEILFGQDPDMDVPAETETHVRSIRSVTRSVIDEGLRQYHVSIVSAQPTVEILERRTVFSLKRLRDFLAQPVWVPAKKDFKKRSRGMLFVTDILRFGSTFALIFAGLFLALNYQSFWQIAKARMTPLLTPPAISIQNDTLGAALAAPAAEAPAEGDMAAFLPPVGPPDDRIIIPKLDLNVPLVQPSVNALLRGDWPQVEQDIQDALQHGVVHYPGTAKPGQAGNFFVTGHSSYYPWAEGAYKTVFARLSELEVGDEYWVYYGGDKHRYIVRSKKEVQPNDITVLDQPTKQRISTLMTCTPVGTTLRRLIVVADEVDLVTGKPIGVGEHQQQQIQTVPLQALPI